VPSFTIDVSALICRRVGVDLLVPGHILRDVRDGLLLDRERVVLVKRLVRENRRQRSEVLALEGRLDDRLEPVGRGDARLGDDRGFAGVGEVDDRVGLARHVGGAEVNVDRVGGGGAGQRDQRGTEVVVGDAQAVGPVVVSRQRVDLVLDRDDALIDLPPEEGR
jgi:hypothetical protein